jgi:hypothetical protein
MTIFVGLNMVASEPPMLFRLAFVVTGLSARRDPAGTRMQRFQQPLTANSWRLAIWLIAKAFHGSLTRRVFLVFNRNLLSAPQFPT